MIDRFGRSSVRGLRSGRLWLLGLTLGAFFNFFLGGELADFDRSGLCGGSGRLDALDDFADAVAGGIAHGFELAVG